MTCYRLHDKAPDIHVTAYVSPEATVIGDVRLGAGVSLWPGAVLRGDNEPICMGEGSNAQEGVVLHTDHGAPLTIGRGVTIGHQAMLHGCTVHDHVLIGIQAVVLNGAVIGESSLVGAGALVTEGKTFAPRSLILGRPAKAVRTLTDEEVENIRRNTEDYVRRGQTYKTALVALTRTPSPTPLTQAGDGREPTAADGAI